MTKNILTEPSDSVGTKINSINPLMDAADVLLNLMPKLRITQENQNPETLRQEILEEIQKFEVRCTNQNLSYENIIGTRYCLCSALDESIMSTPWGRDIVWNQNGLLVTFHNETWGGEKFFQLLSRLCKNAAKNIDLIELQTYCLLLGFEGRYRILENGKSQLETLKRRMIQLIHSIRGKDTSLFFQLSDSSNKKIINSPPLSVTAGISIMLLVILTAYLLYQNALKDFTATVTNNILITKLPVLRVKQEVIKDEFESVRILLTPQIAEKKLTLIDEDNKHIIRLNGDVFFSSGRATLSEKNKKIVSDIGRSIIKYNGNIRITGHTDNLPIHNRYFSSNDELSLARARTIQTLFKELSIPSSRMSVSGEGDRFPLLSNDSEHNRAVNRRVEIILLDDEK